jgi:hypothetical protein
MIAAGASQEMLLEIRGLVAVIACLRAASTGAAAGGGWIAAAGRACLARMLLKCCAVTVHCCSFDGLRLPRCLGCAAGGFAYVLLITCCCIGLTEGNVSHSCRTAPCNRNWYILRDPHVSQTVLKRATYAKPGCLWGMTLCLICLMSLDGQSHRPASSLV